MATVPEPMLPIAAAAPGKLVIHLHRHGCGRKLAVHIIAIRAVEKGAGGPSEHSAALHIGAAHPLRVTESYESILDFLSWAVPE